MLTNAKIKLIQFKDAGTAFRDIKRLFDLYIDEQDSFREWEVNKPIDIKQQREEQTERLKRLWLIQDKVNSLLDKGISEIGTTNPGGLNNA